MDESGLSSEKRTNSENNYMHLDADKVLNAYGKYGRYQMIVYFVTNGVTLLSALNMLVLNFIVGKPEFTCQITEPEGIQWDYTVIDKCTVMDSNNWTVACGQIPNAQYDYNNTEHNLIASEFNLVCSEENATEHVASIFLLGGMFAAPLVTQLSDTFGRRFLFLGPLYLSVICNLLAAWAPTFKTFLALRFLAGFGTTGFYTAAYTLCAESVPTAFRDLVPVFPTIIWVSGYLLAGLLHLLIPNWRWLYFAISLFGILTIPIYWIVPESIHWLINNKKHREVEKYIHTANRINRTVISLSDCKSETIDESTEKPKRSMFDIFTNKALLLQFCLNSFVFMVMNCTYWALSLFSTELSEDKMTGYFLSGLVELPAGILGTHLMVALPRKAVSSMSLFAQGLSFILAACFGGRPNLKKPLVKQPKPILMILSLAAKSFNCVAWAVHPLIVSELAPTTVRNTFYGIVSFMGDIGSVFAPYIKRLETVHKLAPEILIGITSFIAGGCVLLMPETKDKKMPEDLESLDPGPLGKYLMSKKIGDDKECTDDVFLLKNGSKESLSDASSSSRETESMKFE